MRCYRFFFLTLFSFQTLLISFHHKSFTTLRKNSNIQRRDGIINVEHSSSETKKLKEQIVLLLNKATLFCTTYNLKVKLFSEFVFKQSINVIKKKNDDDIVIFSLVLLNIFGYPSVLKAVVRFASYLLYVVGLGLILSSTLEIYKLYDHESNCPNLTRGAYQYIRYPICAGVIFCSLANSIILMDAYRLLAAAALFVVMDKRAQDSSTQLNSSYKFVPFVY